MHNREQILVKLRCYGETRSPVRPGRPVMITKGNRSLKHMVKWKMSGERDMKMERNNSTVNGTSGCDGRSGNQMCDNGDAAISVTGVAGIGSE
jgi:hypothetical protein